MSNSLGLFVAGAALLLTQSPTLSGSVLDPQARVIAGAAVSVRCGAYVERTVTDAAGHFEVAPPAASSCVLVVTAAGFASETLTVKPPERDLTIALRVAPVRAIVDVSAPAISASDIAAGGTGSITLDAAWLSVTGRDIHGMRDFAERAAGLPRGTPATRVNGADVARLAIGTRPLRIAIGTDPFSVESSGSDPLTVDVTAVIERGWATSVVPGNWHAAEGDPISGRNPASSQFRAVSLSGPLSRGGAVRSQVQAAFATAVHWPTYLSPSGNDIHADLRAGTRDIQLGGAVVWESTRQQWHAAFDIGTVSTTNQGVGASTGSAAAATTEDHRRSLQARWTRDGARRSSVATFSVDAHASTVRSDATGQGVIVGDRLVDGAPAVISSQTSSTTWRATYRIRPSATIAQAWLGGVDVSHIGENEDREFNPDGMRFSTMAATTPSVAWHTNAATGTHASSTRVSLLGERVLHARSSLWSRAGLRVEWQSEVGWIWLPRFSIGGRLGAWAVGGNIGRFADGWTTDAEIESDHRRARAARYETPEGPQPVLFESNRDRRRDLAWRVSAGRAFGALRLVAEYNARRATGLGGLARERDGLTLREHIDFGRHAIRNEWRGRIDWHTPALLITATGSVARAFDDTDGLFAPLGRGSREDWTRSATERDWTLALTAMALVREVRVIVQATALSGLRYTRVTGADPQGLLLFNGRDVSGRNGSTRPWQADVSLYASREIVLGRWAVDAGVRMENLLGLTPATDLGRLVGSAYDGRPIAVLAGRSLSVWATLGRH